MERSETAQNDPLRGEQDITIETLEHFQKKLYDKIQAALRASAVFSLSFGIQIDECKQSIEHVKEKLKDSEKRSKNEHNQIEKKLNALDSKLNSNEKRTNEISQNLKETESMRRKSEIRMDKFISQSKKIHKDLESIQETLNGKILDGEKRLQEFSNNDSRNSRDINLLFDAIKRNTVNIEKQHENIQILSKNLDETNKRVDGIILATEKILEMINKHEKRFEEQRQIMTELNEDLNKVVTLFLGTNTK